MGSKIVLTQINTTRSIEEVRTAVARSLMLLGGTVMNFGENIQVTQGVNGVNFAFAAKFEALINIRQAREGIYEVVANINWGPNSVFWICLIFGFFVFGTLWIVPLLYLFIDPSTAYQQTLYQVQMLLQ